MNNTLPIYEMFHSFQGEGVHSGRAAFFIRTSGCPLRCPWCDSAGTWKPKWVPTAIPQIPVEELASEAAASHASFCVVTGGEPTIHNLSPLTGALHVAGLLTHLETSGAFAITGCWEWVTVSPKRWRLPIVEAVEMASEFKVIIEHPYDIDFYLEDLLKKGLSRQPVWLHPEWSHRQDYKVLQAITRRVLTRSDVDFRAGWQVHKLYDADREDPRAREPVPLGGDPEKGF